MERAIDILLQNEAKLELETLGFYINDNGISIVSEGDQKPLTEAKIVNNRIQLIPPDYVAILSRIKKEKEYGYDRPIEPRTVTLSLKDINPDPALGAG